MATNQTKWIAGGAAFVVAFGIAIYLTNRGYGEVSPKTYDYAKALYSICNRRSEDGLQTIERMIAESETAGEISEQESHWLNEIIAEAKAGDWESAAARSRRMMADQVDT